MSKFSVNILLSQIGRLPATEVKELVNKYEDDMLKLSITTVNQILNYVERKFSIVSNWHKSDGLADIMTYKMLATKFPELSKSTFEEIDNMNKLHPMLQVEVAHELSESEKLNILHNFSDKLNLIVIQDFILTLPETKQKEMISKYKDKILECDSDLLVTFIGALKQNVQKYFLQMLKTNVSLLDEEMMTSIITVLYDENIEYFFIEFHDIIQNFDENQFLNFLVMLSGDGVALCSKHFNTKIKDIPADVLMYKLGRNVDDQEQIYNIWKANSSKLAELSDAYFNLIISRLNDEFRISSLADFKEKYNTLSIEELLDLFKFDSDEIKAKLFLEYKDKLSKLDGIKFIGYVSKNINNPLLRNKIFLLYKDYLCKQTDEVFITFINMYSEENLRYGWRLDNETIKEKLENYIIDNFKERLQSIETKFLPNLFSSSATCLQHRYISILKEKLEKLISEKTYIKSLLNATWGNSKGEFLEAFSEQLKILSAKDWYELTSILQNQDYEIIENLLLNCDIEDFDFANNEALLSSNNPKRIFYYFEKNIQNKMYERYTTLVQDNKIDDLMTIYDEIVTKIVNADSENILIDYDCINLLVLLRVLLKHNIINDQDEYYLLFKEMYMNKLLKRLEKENEENINLIKDGLFYRLVKGSINPTMLVPISTLKGLIFFSKNIVGLNDQDDINVYYPTEIEKFVNNLTEEQVIGLNNKLFKQICKKILDNYKADYPQKESIRNLAIRLYLSVGFNNAKNLINLDVPFTRYEYIFNGINIKDIKLNNSGEPIINKKLNDFMFGSSMEDNNTNMNRLLQDRIPTFERKFADIYNGWDAIYQNLNGDVTVSRILKYFEENKILLNPDEYRLAPVLKEIGPNEDNLQQARILYNDMKNRKYSTIPKIIGIYDDEYTYEMLDLDDPLGLVVGYITRCCFLIDGLSKSALYHSAQSKDGRIFVVRKNGELIAQSWVWRNGNLVCFDNVETRGSYDWDILLEVYKKASKKIIDISNKEESIKEQVKLVTFGGGYSKMSKPDEMVASADIRTPRVRSNIYTDAKFEQFVLATTDDKELYYGDVSAQYKDTRKVPCRYTNIMSLSSDEKSVIAKGIKAIDFTKNKNIRMLDFDKYQYVAMTDDWYILLTNNGNVECVILDFDSRAKEEIYDEISKLEDIFANMGIYQDAKQVGDKVLALVKRGV